MANIAKDKLPCFIVRYIGEEKGEWIRHKINNKCEKKKVRNREAKILVVKNFFVLLWAEFPQ